MICLLWSPQSKRVPMDEKTGFLGGQDLEESQEFCAWVSCFLIKEKSGCQTIQEFSFWWREVFSWRGFPNFKQVNTQNKRSSRKKMVFWDWHHFFSRLALEWFLHDLRPFKHIFLVKESVPHESTFQGLHHLETSTKRQNFLMGCLVSNFLNFFCQTWTCFHSF